MDKRLSKSYFDKRLRDLAPIMGWRNDVWDNSKMVPGAVFADYYKYGGGYHLSQISSPTGGERVIGPRKRMSAKEFDAFLDGVAWAMGWASSAAPRQDLQMLPNGGDFGLAITAKAHGDALTITQA
jgi:hypothetical protein